MGIECNYTNKEISIATFQEGTFAIQVVSPTCTYNVHVHVNTLIYNVHSPVHVHVIHVLYFEHGCVHTCIWVTSSFLISGSLH